MGHTQSDAPVDIQSWRRRIAEMLDWAEDEGYFGPASAMWQVNSEAVLGLGLGRAVLMQLAHPWVAQAIADSGSARTHPTRRLLGTMEAAEILVFGSRRQADEVAARIRAIHAHVRGTLDEDVGRWSRGTPYRADDPDALLWVLATLVDTALTVYTAALGRMPRQTEEGYIADSARLGALLGLDREPTWRDRASLGRYIRDRIADGTVCAGSHGRQLARELVDMSLSPDANGWWRLSSASMLAVAERTMPRPLWEQLDLGVEHGLSRRYRGMGMVGRRLLRRLPTALRVDPITRMAMRRGEVYRRLSWT
jgi:uncharacterized protein (DUF2236 family)